MQICTVCAFISVIELPMIPAYYPKKLVYLWIIERYRICKSSSSSIELFYKKIIGLIPKSHQEIFLILLLAASLHYIIKLLYNTHAFIDPVLNHRSTYFKIVGYFFSFHSIRSHGQSSFFCLWHHDFIKIESQIADIFQLDDDNTPV